VLASREDVGTRYSLHLWEPAGDRG
jgi:hypothetical protein